MQLLKRTRELLILLALTPLLALLLLSLAGLAVSWLALVAVFTLIIMITTSDGCALERTKPSTGICRKLYQIWLKTTISIQTALYCHSLKLRRVVRSFGQKVQRTCWKGYDALISIGFVTATLVVTILITSLAQ